MSHIAQHETGAKWAAENNATVVGTFEDLDVSADKFDPWKRPDLGQWLQEERLHEWDVIIWSKIDRAFRNTRDCVYFAEWAKKHRKVVVFAEDGLKLNYRDADGNSIDAMMAELFVYLGSFFGQLELNRFKTRALDGHRVLRQTDRWASGVPPLGFQVVDHPSGKGKGLDTDQYGKDLLYEMAGRLIDGWSFIRITQWLNDEGYRSNYDRARAEAGKQPRDRPWTVDNVIRALTSLKTQGFKMHKGQPVLTPTGDMIQMAPPTFDDDTWSQIQVCTEKRRENRRTRTRSSNPMLGVGKCGACGASLAQQFSSTKLANGETREYRSYRCGRTPVNCKSVTMRAEDADELLEQTFMEKQGDQRVKTQRFLPGEDHSKELETVKTTIERLRRESDAGLIVGDEDEELYFQRMKSLVARRTELEKTPYRKAGWITEELDQTYSEVWSQADMEKHREMLIDAGVQFVLNGKYNFDLFVPEPTP